MSELARDEELRSQLSNELRLFGSISRAQIRDHVDDFTTRLADLNGDGAERGILVEDLRVSTERFSKRIVEVIETWRALRADIHDAAFPRLLRETYQFVDEFFSLTVETKVSELLKAIDDCESARQPLAEVRNELRDLVISERSYRRGAGYSLDGENDAHLVYRGSKLKKFVTSVLWLEITKEKVGKRLTNVGAAIAAGVAMTFAVLATIVQMKWWLINTREFVIAAVITYMLKDRIKDWLKNFFARRLTRFLFDYSVKIRDPISGLAIGRCREAMRYIAMEDVPASVLESRRRDAKTLIDAEAKPEVVIRYEKEIRLDSRAAIERLHSDDFDINDIIRFSLAEFLQRADDPVSTVPLLDEQSDTVELVPFRKVYHLNLVMVFHVGGENDRNPATKRVRVVFDKDAIQRLDEVN